LKGGHLKNLKDIENHPNLTFIEADIRDKEAIAPFFKDIHVVYHLAALADIVPSIENPREYFETNVNGTFNVLEASIENKIKKFVYSASSSCYGIAKEYPTTETAKIDPQYPYALTKYLGEETVMHFEKVYKLPAISLRFFNVYGPRARTTGAYGAVFGVFLAQKLNNKPLTVVGDGSQTRDFTYVIDVANAIYTASLSDISGEIFNVGSSGHYSVNQLVSLLDSETIQIPRRPGEPDCTFADVSKIKKMLNWEAKVSFEEGVKKLLNKIEDFKDAPIWDKKTIEKATEKWFEYLSPKEETFK
jgi:UDP-glucose 4-epimerase